MGKQRSGGNKQRAMQQQIASGMDRVTKDWAGGQPTKADLRAMIPTYDETLVRKIETGKKTIKKG